MESILTPSNIMFVLGILGVIFSVFNFFRKPQEDLEKKAAINEERDKNKATVLDQRQVENKAALLEQQVRLAFEASEKKFADIMARMDANTTMAQNHIHTVDTKVDVLTLRVGDMEKTLVRLATIIEERIPKK